MYFSEQFINIMIMASLVAISIASVVLIVLLINDIRRKRLW